MSAWTGPHTPHRAHRTRDCLLETVRGTLRDDDLLPHGCRVLVACSGGADSVALLHLLCRLRPEAGWQLHVGHVHHGLRPGAEEDAAFVAALARRLGLPYSERRLQGLAGPDLEARARAARYRALAEMAREAGAQAVATGHTLDDQAETVLLRLLRGTGAAGLAGIRPRRPIAPGVEVVRPLLWCRREELRRFLTEEGEGWREDESNADPRFARNRVREQLMPRLVAENPALPVALAQLAEVVREEEVVWAEWVAETLRKLARPAPGGRRVPRPEFLALPAALQRRVLRELAGNPGAVSFVHVEEARRMVRAGRTGQELSLGGGVRLRLESGSFWVGRPEEAPACEPVPLSVPGRVVVPELGVMVEARLEPTTSEVRGRWEAELDERWAERQLVVRTRRPGDRVRLRVGTRKLQDLLVDLRIPRWERARVPLVATSEGEVLWVVGHRVADAARPEPSAARRLVLRAWPLEVWPTPGRRGADGILGEQLPAGGGPASVSPGQEAIR